MTPISLIAAALMVYSVIGRVIDDSQHSDESKEIDDVYRNTAYVCGLKRVNIDPRNSRNRFTDDGILYDYFYDDSSLDKIIGGNYATYGDIPWQANIYLDADAQCGGAIIAEYWILSSSHCFELKMRRYYRIVVGDHILDRVDTGEQTFSVEVIFPHEKYQKNNSDYDIALIKIAPTQDGRGIRFTDYVQPICLPDSTDALPVETFLTVSGWGIYSLSNNASSPILKQASLPIINRNDCKNLFPKWFTPNMICAGYKRAATKTCGGDSGGPATAKLNGANYLFGLVSFGKCWLPYSPTVFVNVPMYINWIISHINRNKPEAQNYIPRRPSNRSPAPLPDDSDDIIFNAQSSNMGR